MSNDSRDDAERKARAARLREEINRITKGSPGDDAKAGATERPKDGESPREFIHRRMRELDEKEK